MPYSESLAERIRIVLGRKKNIVEKKMFGGVGFLLNGNLCVGIWKDSFVARVGPEQYKTALTLPHVKKFDITGKEMKGWVLVKSEGVETDEELAKWIKLSVKFASSLIPK